MDRATFEARFRTAVGGAVAFACQYVLEDLPDDVAVRVYPNQSYDGNPRVGDETTFPEESLPAGEYLGPWSPEQAVNFLWRDGRVPEWIDVAVRSIADGRVVVALRCCGRFTAQDELLYHQGGGLPPCSVKSPYLPPGWESIESSGKFSIYCQDWD